MEKDNNDYAYATLHQLMAVDAKIDSDFKWVLGFWLSTIALIILTMIPVALRILGVI